WTRQGAVTSRQNIDCSMPQKSATSVRCQLWRVHCLTQSPLGKRFPSFVIPATTCDGGEHATVDGGGSSSDGGSHGSGARDDGPDQLDTGWADGSAADGAEPEPGPEPRLRSEQPRGTDRLDRRRWLGPR